MYYVIGDGGAKYGPADIATLKQWAAENRLAATTMLEDASTGAQIAASQVPGLFDSPTYSAPTAMPSDPVQPTSSPYQSPGASSSPYSTPTDQNSGPYSSPGAGQSPYSSPGQSSSPYSQNPYGHSQAPNYASGNSGNGGNYVIGAWILSVMSLLCCPICLGPGAIFCAYKADKEGHPQGKLLLGISIGATVLGMIVGAILNIAMRSGGAGLGQ